MYDSLTPKQKIAAARIKVQKKAPYFARALRSLIPYEAPGLGTMAVTETGVVMYDPETVLSWRIDELAAVLIHELGHVIRSHASRARRMKVATNQRLIWNIAADAEINDDLVEGGWVLPGDPVLPNKIDMRDGLTAEEYFRELLSRAEEESKSPDPQQMQGSGGQGSPGQSSEDGQESSEGGGSSDTPDYSDGGADDKCPKGSQIQPSRKSSRDMDLPRDGSGAGYEVPNEPKDVPGKSKAEMDRIRNVVAEQIRQESGRSRGSVPGGWVRWADDRLAPPEIPWQQKLGVLARRAVTYKAGVVDYRYDRPSRRQGMFGFGDNKIILPRMRAPVPRVTIAIDT